MHGFIMHVRRGKMNEAALIVNEKLVEIVGVIVFIEHAFYSYALQIYTNFL